MHSADLSLSLQPKLDFLPIRLAVADKAKYAAALALLTPLLLPFAASVGTNSHLLQVPVLTSY